MIEFKLKKEHVEYIIYSLEDKVESIESELEEIHAEGYKDSILETVLKRYSDVLFEIKKIKLNS